MSSKKKNFNDKAKIISAVISLGVILTLVFGIYSVVNSVNKAGENIINLNEEEEQVAIKEKPIEVGDDEIINANARASMSYDGDGTENKQKEPEISKVEEKKEEEKVEITQPKPLTAEEVMANAISNYSFSENDKLKWPVSGEISLKFSMENTIYFKSLGKYKTSPAIIIKAEQGTNVAASASGVVVAVNDNEETKTTLRVAIGNGYEVTYGLLDNVIVKEGDTVTAGQLIGNVTEPTAYYKLEGPGVYMKVENNRVPVDPTLYLE